MPDKVYSMNGNYETNDASTRYEKSFERVHREFRGHC